MHRTLACTRQRIRLAARSTSGVLVVQRRYTTPLRHEDAPPEKQAVPLRGYYAELLETCTTDRLETGSVSRTTRRANSPKGSQESETTATAQIVSDSKPDEPTTCCMSGCVNCVWDTYREDLEAWAAENADARTTAESASARVDDALDDVPVGIREFIKMEKMVKERRQGRE